MKLPRLKTTFALLVVGAATAMFAPGCHGDPTAECTDLCTKSQKCTGAQPQNCSQLCTNNSNLADASGCGSDYDNVLNCESGLSDVCTANTACSQPLGSLAGCVLVYCVQHANDPNCKINGG